MEARIFRLLSATGVVATTVAGVVTAGCSVGDIAGLTAPTFDAGTAAVADSGTRRDSSASDAEDAQVQVEAGPTVRFCDALPADTNRLACYDFDEARPTFPRETPSQATIELKNDAFSSGPRSMVVTTDAVTDGYVKGVLALQLPQILDRRGTLSIAYDVRVDQTHPRDSQGVGVAFLQGPSGNDFQQITTNINAYSGGAYAFAFTENTTPWPADAGSNFITHRVFDKTPEMKTTWTRVEMRITIDNPTGAGNLLGVFVNDSSTPIFEGPLTFPFKGINPRVEFGLGNLKLPSEPWVVRYDNIVVTFAQQ